METANQHIDFNHIAEITIAYRPVVKAADRPVVSKHEEAYRILRRTWDEQLVELQEQVKVMLLNAGNRLLGIYTCATGGTAQCIVDVKLILAAALKSNAAKIILCHNHPSGNLKPSQSDKMITEKLKTAARYLDITLADHLILTSSSYLSFAHEGLL